MPLACAVFAACLFESGIQSAPATVNGDSLKVVGTINVGRFADALAITPDGNHIYVANYGSSTVSVIDTVRNAVTATISVTLPTNVAITPNGATAFVLTGSNISVISTSTNTVVKTISSGPSFGTGLAVTPDGTQLYVSNFYGTVSIINVANYQLEKTLTVGNNAFAVAISPDGTSAYVEASPASGPFYLTKITVASQTIAAAQLGAGVFHHGMSGALAFSPDSQTVYVPGGETDVVVLNAVTGQLENRIVLFTQPQNSLGGVQISPGGKFLYVVESTANAVATLNTLQGTVVGTPVAVGDLPDGMAIDPTGTWLYVGNGKGHDVSVIRIRR